MNKLIRLLLFSTIPNILLSGCLTITLGSGDKGNLQCPASVLLIDEHILPERQWQDVWRDNEAPMRIGIDGASTGFSTSSDGGVVQIVYLLESVNQADKEYASLEKGLFRETKFISEWFVPKPLYNLPLKADQYKLACSSAIPSGSIRCVYLALYNAYLIEVHADVNAVQYSGVENIVLSIDERANSCVENK